MAGRGTPRAAGASPTGGLSTPTPAQQQACPQEFPPVLSELVGESPSASDGISSRAGSSGAESSGRVAASLFKRPESVSPTWVEGVTLEDIRRTAEAFASERDWDQFHLPRNLVLAMMGEMGEVAELFRWKSDKDAPPYLTNWPPADKDKLADELADVMIFLTRLADRCGIDLGQAVSKKFMKNRAKYPSDLVRGSSKKYTEFDGYERRVAESEALSEAARTSGLNANGVPQPL
jgi:dCTP diphosphatase